MANTFKFGNGEWAVGKETALAYNDENSNFKPLPFTFDRASTATVVNKQGLIETVGVDEPRIDFLNNTKGHLLLEPSRQNKLSTSNDFNGSGWLISFLTVSANQVISPDGTLNASKLEMTGDGSLRNQSEAFFNDGYAYSIFVKKGNSRYVTIRSAFFTQSFSCGFDLDTLTTEANGKIEDYGNDWYRLSITKNISGDADRGGFFYIYLPNSLGSTTSVSGNYVYFYGAQIEDGSYATSYIPTQGSAVTRSAETCNNAGNSNVFNDSEGVLYAEIFKELNQSTTTAIGFSVSSGRLKIYITSSGKLEVQLTPSSGDSVNFYNNSIDLSIFNKVAFRYNSNGENSLFLNGVKIATTTGVSFSPSTLNSLNFDFGNGSEDFYGNVKDIKVYNTALTDAELIALTS